MTEDLSWQQTQSTDPSSDGVATEQKQTDQTVGLVWSAEAETPVIRGGGCLCKLETTLRLPGAAGNCTRPSPSPRE